MEARREVRDETCTNCGTAPVHWAIAEWKSYCRPCAESRGHGYAFTRTIDLDNLRELQGMQPAEVWVFLASIGAER